MRVGLVAGLLLCGCTSHPAPPPSSLPPVPDAPQMAEPSPPLAPPGPPAPLTPPAPPESPPRGATYHVGPGQALANIGDVPWYRLEGGDTVYIHYRSAPYHEKFLISTVGTPTRWLRVIGVPGPNGELPVISGDGATTGPNMHHRWQDATGGSAIQNLGVIQIALRADAPGGLTPAYVEIASLQVQDGFKTFRFTAENGTVASYDGFAACIYSRSVRHLVVRDTVLSNCGQGFYNWTGSGASDQFWEALQVDTVLRNNQFVGNGNPGSYTEHQIYTESDGVIIEGNRFGAQRAGALGSQIKDRSAGTVIRYNAIEQSAEGWDIDLVEPQEGYATLGRRPGYRQAFVYGNVIVNKTRGSNYVHWNEDHQQNQGRAVPPDGRLFFYDNTVVTVADRSEMGLVTLFNGTWGAYDCPPHPPAGVIDVRNNVFAALPRTPGSAPPQIRFAYCGTENFELGRNWVSPGYELKGRAPGGVGNLVSPARNDPGFVDVGGDDYRLEAGSSAAGIAGPLAPETTHNALGIDATPTQQYAPQRRLVPRPTAGPGSDVGAFGRAAP